MTDTTRVLLEIKRLYRMTGDSISLDLVHKRLREKFKMSSKQIASHLKTLDLSHKIDMSYNRIKPIGVMKNGVIRKSDILDVLGDKPLMKPAEAFEYWSNKHNTTGNPETFTRLMRQMAQDGELMRQGERYYLCNNMIQRKLK
jgi:hypothetical protein